MTIVHEFARAKADGRRISIVTAYDAWSARIVASSNVDAILVGDSAAMVVHGHSTTINATVAMMARHTTAVVRAAAGKLVIADLPFLSFRKGTAAAMSAVERLIRSGASAVKLEGVDGHEEAIAHIVQSGIPVMGHIGLVPQSIHQLGGFRVQGRGEVAAADVFRQARALQQLGCFSVVLECVPGDVVARVTADLTISTIGIGAGSHTDGQVLVFHDLVGLSARTPRFVRRYLEASDLFTDALNRYDDDVKASRFPCSAETYS